MIYNEPKEGFGLIVLKYILPIVITPFSVWLTITSTIPSTANTVQTVFSERKIDAYLGLSARLAKGRNPNGDDPQTDTLPVHRNFETFETWWRSVDDYFYKNESLFDSTSKSKYAEVNVIALKHRKIMREATPLTDSLKHELKEPMSKSIRQLNEWFSIYLNDKYGIDKGL